MAEVLNFEHNGITVNATESPEAMGALATTSSAWSAPRRMPTRRSRKNAPFRINSFTTQALLDPTGSEAGTLFQAVYQILKVVKVPVYVVIVEEGATPADTINHVIGGNEPVTGRKLGLAALSSVPEDLTIIGAPGFTGTKAVASEFAAFGKRIKARVVLDGKDASVADQVTYSGELGGADLGFDRCLLVHNMPSVYSKARRRTCFFRRRPWPSLHWPRSSSGKARVIR